MFFAQCFDVGFNMANIEYKQYGTKYNDTAYIGGCWCQIGESLIADLDPCCKTVLAAKCDIPGKWKIFEICVLYIITNSFNNIQVTLLDYNFLLYILC